MPVSDSLRRLAGQVRGLLPSARNPEQFHVRKDQIRAELVRLALRLDRGAA